MLYMYSVKPSDIVTTLGSVKPVNPVVSNRGSTSQGHNRPQPSFDTTTRQQQQTPPPIPSSTAFQNFRSTSTLSSKDNQPDLEVTDAPIQRRRRPQFSSTATPFVLTTPFRETDTTEPFVLEGSSGGFSPLHARGAQPLQQPQSIPSEPHSQRSPPQPQGFSPPSQRSPPQPQSFSPLSQRSPPQPRGIQPQVPRFPPQPQGFSPPLQRLPPQPQGFSPPPLVSQQTAQHQHQSEVRPQLSPPQPSFQNQQQEQPIPKKLKVRVRKPAGQNLTFPVLHDDAIINSPQVLAEVLAPPKKVAPASPSGPTHFQFPSNSPLAAFEGLQIAQESGLKHTKFPSLQFNIPGALFLGSSTKIFKPKPIPSRSPPTSTVNPFLVPVSTVAPSIENAPRYVRLLNRYSLLESPSGESNFPASAETPGVINNSAHQPAFVQSQSPSAPQAPSARKFHNPNFGGSVSSTPSLNQHQPIAFANAPLISNQRKTAQPGQEVQSHNEEDSQLSNSDEVTAINEVFARQTSLKRTQPASSVTQTTFTTPISTNEQESKRIINNAPSHIQTFDSALVSNQKQTFNSASSPVTESSGVTANNPEIGSTEALYGQLSKQRNRGFQTGATLSVSFPSTTPSEGSVVKKLPLSNSGFQSRKLSLDVPPVQPSKTLILNHSSTSNVTKAVNQRGRSRYQGKTEKENGSIEQIQQENHSSSPRRRTPSTLPNAAQQTPAPLFTSLLNNLTTPIAGASSRTGRFSSATSTTRQVQSHQQFLTTTQSAPSILQVSPRSSVSQRGRLSNPSSLETSVTTNAGISGSTQSQSSPLVGRGKPHSTTPTSNLSINKTSLPPLESKFPTKQRNRFATSQFGSQFTPPSAAGSAGTSSSAQSTLNSDPNEITTQSSILQETSTKSLPLHHRRRFATSTPTAPASHIESIATITSTAAIPTNSSNKREHIFKPRGIFSRQLAHNTFSNSKSDAQSPDTSFESSNESLRIAATDSKIVDIDDATVDANEAAVTTSSTFLPETTSEQVITRRKFNPRRPGSFSGKQSNASTQKNSSAENESQSVAVQKRGKISSSKSTPLIQQQQNSKPKSRSGSFRRTTTASHGLKSVTEETGVVLPITTNPPRFKPRPLAKSRLFAQTAAALSTSTLPNPDETATIVNQDEVLNSTETFQNSSTFITTTTEAAVTEFRKFKPRTGFPRFQDSVSKRTTTSIPAVPNIEKLNGQKGFVATELNSSSNTNSKSSKRFKPRPIAQRFTTTETTIQDSTTSSHVPSSSTSVTQNSQRQPLRARTNTFNRGTPFNQPQPNITTPASTLQLETQTSEIPRQSVNTHNVSSQSGADGGFGGKRRRRPFGSAASSKKSVPTLKHDDSTESAFTNPAIATVPTSTYVPVQKVLENIARVTSSQEGEEYLRVNQENTSSDEPRKRRKLKRRKVSQRSTPSDQRGADSNIHAVLTNFTSAEGSTTLSSPPFTVHSSLSASTTPAITTFHRKPEVTTLLPVTNIDVTTVYTTPPITTFRTTPAITTFHRAPVDITTFRATPAISTSTVTDTVTKKPVLKISLSTASQPAAPTTLSMESTSRATIPGKKDDIQVIKNKPFSTNKLREISKSKLLAAISAQQRLSIEDESDPDREILAMEADESGDAAGIWFSEPDAGTDTIGSGVGIQRRASGGGSSETDSQSAKREESTQENSSIIKSVAGEPISSIGGESSVADDKTWLSFDGLSKPNADESSPKKSTINSGETEKQPGTLLDTHTVISISQESEESMSLSPSFNDGTTTEGTTTSKGVQKSRSASFSVSSSTSVQKEISKSRSSNKPSTEERDANTNEEKGPPTLIIIDKVGLTNDEYTLSSSIRGRGKSSGGSSSNHEVEIEVTTSPSEKTSGSSSDGDISTAKPSTNRPPRNRSQPGVRSDREKDEKTEDEKHPPRTNGIIGRGANRDRLPKSNARRNQQRSETTTVQPETTEQLVETTTTITGSTSPATNVDEVKVKSPFDEVGYFGEEEVAPISHGALDGPLDGELESGALDGLDGGDLSPGGTGEEEVLNAGVAEHTDPNDAGHKSEPAVGSDDSSKWDLSSLRESPSFNIEVRSRAPKSIQLAARREAKSTGSDVNEDDAVRFLDDRIEPQKKMRTILKLIELKSRFTAERNSPRQIKSSSAAEEVAAFLETLDRDSDVDNTPKGLIGLGKYAYDPSEEKSATPSTQGAAEFFKLLLSTASPPTAEQQKQASSDSKVNGTTESTDAQLGPINCSRSDRNICPTSEGYPREFVESILNKHKMELQRLWSELQIDSTPEKMYPEDAKRLKADLSVCDSVVEALRPGWARDAVSGKWMLIINTEQFPQVVRVESCLRPKKECLFISPYYKSLCVEHQSTQRLVAIRPDQPENGPVIGIFKLPCGCSCQIEMLHGASGNN